MLYCKFFQLATLRGNEPLVKLLLKNNADTQYKNKVRVRFVLELVLVMCSCCCSTEKLL